MAIGWQRVFTHRGTVITGNFSVRSRMISKEALPEPIMIAARKTVNAALAVCKTSSTFRRESRCSDKFSSLVMPLK